MTPPLVAFGEGPILASSDRADFRLGDLVICTRNEPSLGVLNGTRGTIESFDGLRELVINVSGQCRRLPADYFRGHLDHGYATNIHKSQGETVSHAFVLVTPTLFREAGYVALSRARFRTDLYLGGSEFDEIGASYGEAKLSDLKSIGWSRRKRLASVDHIPRALTRPSGPTIEP